MGKRVSNVFETLEQDIVSYEFSISMDAAFIEAKEEHLANMDYFIQAGQKISKTDSKYKLFFLELLETLKETRLDYVGDIQEAESNITHDKVKLNEKRYILNKLKRHNERQRSVLK